MVKDKQYKEPVYTIGIVAKMLDVCHATLRIWERKSLIKPSRIGKNRFYSASDLDKLKYIKDLVQKKHINIEGAKKIIDSFKKVKLPDVQRIMNSYPHQLSGGQLQRVAIAMAISSRPDILIADEPTSSLDVTIESQIIHLFKDLQKELNLTYVFISHDLRVVEYMADRVAVMKNGEIIETGTSYEIYSSPKHDYTKKLLHSVLTV